MESCNNALCLPDFVVTYRLKRYLPKPLSCVVLLVDGNWSDWNDWSDCPVTCGGGVQNRSRTCTSPPPAFGGRPCPGESDETRPCNERPCPGKENTFASYTLHFYSKQKKRE